MGTRHAYKIGGELVSVWRSTGLGIKAQRRERKREAEAERGIFTALRSNALKKVLGHSLMRALERLDEDDALVWLALFGIEALDADGHCGKFAAL